MTLTTHNSVVARALRARGSVVLAYLDRGCIHQLAPRTECAGYPFTL
jgi:hypothetical protein